MPGDLGSQIEGKINKLTAPHFFCDKHSDWFTLWANDKLILPGYDECFVENAKSVYPIIHVLQAIIFIHPSIHPFTIMSFIHS